MTHVWSMAKIIVWRGVVMKKTILIVMVHLPDMSAEYWTELEFEEVEAILKEKHKYR